MPDFQEIFNKAQLEASQDRALVKKVRELYNQKNQFYSYFDSPAERSKETFVCYFHFFKEVSKSEDSRARSGSLSSTLFKENHIC